MTPIIERLKNRRKAGITELFSTGKECIEVDELKIREWMKQAEIDFYYVVDSEDQDKIMDHYGLFIEPYRNSIHNTLWRVWIRN